MYISQFYAVLIYVDGRIDLSIVIYLSKEYCQGYVVASTYSCLIYLLISLVGTICLPVSIKKPILQLFIQSIIHFKTFDRVHC